jgi:hypothetical protein
MILAGVRQKNKITRGWAELAKDPARRSRVEWPAEGFDRYRGQMGWATVNNRLCLPSAGDSIRLRRTQPLPALPIATATCNTLSTPATSRPSFGICWAAPAGSAGDATGSPMQP